MGTRSVVVSPLPRHERRPLRLPAALLTAPDAGDLGIGLAIQRRREDAYSDGPSIGWSAGPRFSNRAFSFSTEFASKLYRGASALATGSMCISHPTRGTPAAGQCGSRSRAALGQHGDGDRTGEMPECRVPQPAEFRHLDRRDRGRVLAEIHGNQAQPGTPISPRKNPARPAAVGGLIGVGIRGEKAADPAPTMTTCNRDPP